MVSRPTLAAAVLSLLCAAGALATPPSINHLATRRSLSAEEQSLIRAYAEFWTESLVAANEQPAEVRTISRELIEPLRRGGVTEVFRTTYGRALTPGLEKVVDEGNAHVSVAGVIVLSQVGTDKALDMLVDRTSKTREPRRHIRLAAARGSGQLLQAAATNGNAVPNKDITSAARRLQAAVAAEEDCFALRHQFEAIRVASETIPATGQAQVRGVLVSALESTAKRAAAPESLEPTKVLDAIYPALNKMRVTYLQLPVTDQRTFGKLLAPALEELLRVTEARWKDLREDDRNREQLGQIIYLCERFLATVDTIVRGQKPPDTALKKAWDEGDAATYTKDMDRWRAVLDKPPY